MKKTKKPLKAGAVNQFGFTSNGMKNKKGHAVFSGPFQNDYGKANASNNKKPKKKTGKFSQSNDPYLHRVS